MRYVSEIKIKSMNESEDNFRMIKYHAKSILNLSANQHIVIPISFTGHNYLIVLKGYYYLLNLKILNEDKTVLFYVDIDLDDREFVMYVREKRSINFATIEKMLRTIDSILFKLRLSIDFALQDNKLGVLLNHQGLDGNSLSSYKHGETFGIKLNNEVFAEFSKVGGRYMFTSDVFCSYDDIDKEHVYLTYQQLLTIEDIYVELI